MELAADAIDRLLDRWPLAHLASAGPDGPHLVPIVFARAGGFLWSPIDGKPKRAGETARVRHLRADARAALLLDHWDADWQRLWWLRIDAEATVLCPADPAREPGVAEALAALRRKYPQYGAVPLLGDPPTLLRFAPRRVRSWRAGPAAAPRV